MQRDEEVLLMEKENELLRSTIRRVRVWRDWHKISGMASIKELDEILQREWTEANNAE